MPEAFLLREPDQSDGDLPAVSATERVNEMTHMEEEKESLRKEAVTVIELKDKEKKHNVVFVKNGIVISKAWVEPQRVNR